MSLPDTVVRRALLLVALSSIAVLGLIALFIFKEGAPLMARVGLGNFLGAEWNPAGGSFGIALMIVGTAVVTGGALCIGVPFGIACAIVLAEMAPPRASMLLKPMIELLAGIPSVVYGFLGIVVLLPWIRDNAGGPGASALAGSIILGIMILPTVTGISIDALQAVPSSYREGSLAMGATRWQTVRLVVLPAARSGLVAAIILGMGRAVGETMAVIMVAGNSVQMPRSLLDPVRTMTANIALEMGYAAGDHRAGLFATGIMLFLIIMALNGIANVVRAAQRRRPALPAPHVPTAEEMTAAEKAAEHGPGPAGPR